MNIMAFVQFVVIVASLVAAIYLFKRLLYYKNEYERERSRNENLRESLTKQREITSKLRARHDDYASVD